MQMLSDYRMNSSPLQTGKLRTYFYIPLSNLSKLPETMIKEGDVHFTEDGYIHLADQVTDEILAAIRK